MLPPCTCLERVLERSYLVLTLSLFTRHTVGGGGLNSQWLKSCNQQTQTSFFETDVFFFCWQFVKPQRKMRWELGSGMNTRGTRIRFFTWVSWHERCTLRSARRTWHECQINWNINFLNIKWESIGHKPPSFSRYCQIIALLAETLWERRLYNMYKPDLTLPPKPIIYDFHTSMITAEPVHTWLTISSTLVQPQDF